MCSAVFYGLLQMTAGAAVAVALAARLVMELIVPTLCVGMSPVTLRVTLVPAINLNQPSLPGVISGAGVTPVLGLIHIAAL